MSFGIDRFRVCDSPFFFRCECSLDFPRNGQCHLALQHQDISERSRVVLGPQMGIGPSIDELRRYTYVIARLQDRPFNHGIDTEFLHDIRYQLVCVFVMHGRSAGDDPEGFDFAEFGAQRVRHAVHEVFLLRVAGKILEWQHHNRRNGFCRRQRNGFSHLLFRGSAQFERYDGCKEHHCSHGRPRDEPRQCAPRPLRGFSSVCSYGFRWQRGTLQFDRCLFECDGNITDIAQTATWLLLQTAAEQDLNVCRRGLGQSVPIGLCLQNIGQRVGNRLASEGNPACQHLVQHTAERPDVAALLRRLAAGLLRAHVGRRADYPARLGDGALLVRRFTTDRLG